MAAGCIAPCPSPPEAWPSHESSPQNWAPSSVAPAGTPQNTGQFRSLAPQRAGSTLALGLVGRALVGRCRQSRVRLYGTAAGLDLQGFKGHPRFAQARGAGTAQFMTAGVGQAGPASAARTISSKPIFGQRLAGAWSFSTTNTRSVLVPGGLDRNPPLYAHEPCYLL
jgi:hypothetical protein